MAGRHAASLAGIDLRVCGISKSLRPVDTGEVGIAVTALPVRPWARCRTPDSRRGKQAGLRSMRLAPIRQRTRTAQRK